MASGIYEIVSPSGKRYIGSAVDIEDRWKGHRRKLRSGRHHNRALTNAYLKYGEIGLRFAVLEYCDASQLLVREQHYIDAQPWVQLYNIAPQAGSNRGFIHSAESRERMRIAQQALAKMPGRRELLSAAQTGVKHSAQTRAKLSALRTGRTLSDAHCRAISEGQRGRDLGDHWRANLSAAHKGKQLSAAHKAAIGAAHVGKTRTATARANISAAVSAARNTSGFTGVSYFKLRDKWQARATIGGKSQHLGLFDSAELANAYRLYWLATQGVF